MKKKLLGISVDDFSSSKISDDSRDKTTQIGLSRGGLKLGTPLQVKTTCASKWVSQGGG